MKKHILLILSLIIIITTATACNETVKITSDGGKENTNATNDFPVEITGVTISQKPTKVAVLSPEIADCIIALGYETSLITATENCTQAELASLTKIKENDYQSIIDFGCDLVIGRDLDSKLIDNLSSSNITVIEIPSATDRSDYERLYSHIASALYGGTDGLNHGIATAKNIFTTLDDLARIIPQNEQIVTAVYITNVDGNAVTGGTLTDTIMSYAGITNAFSGSIGGTFKFDDLLKTNPNYIFCLEGLKEKILTDSRFSKLTAVKTKKVFELPNNYLTWEGRTVISLATDLAGIVYPDLLKATKDEPELPDISSPASETSLTESSFTISDLDNISNNIKNYETLNFEETSDGVLSMQKRLAELSYLTVEYSGYFGESTKNALLAFEQKAGLTVDGIADNTTLQALYSENAPKA